MQDVRTVKAIQNAFLRRRAAGRVRFRHSVCLVAFRPNGRYFTLEIGREPMDFPKKCVTIPCPRRVDSGRHAELSDEAYG